MTFIVFMYIYIGEKLNETYIFHACKSIPKNIFYFLYFLYICILLQKIVFLLIFLYPGVPGLRKLKYLFISYILHTIYNSLILPHINYSLLALGTKCQKIELLQKKAVRVVHSKSPFAHTTPLFKKMNNLWVSDLYTCNLLKMYYKLYRNMLPVYFESFIPEYGD